MKHNTEHQPKQKDDKLDKMIEQLEVTLSGMNPTNENYALVADNLGKLMELKQFRDMSALEQKSKKKEIKNGNKLKIDPNSAMQVVGFLVGIVLCIKAEQVGPIATKAFSIVPRMVGGLRRV